ncbi:MAG TPA: phosphatase PAP2 family protein [Pirellulales bacterium]|nr:phosphatase PAP2 family protein [Pirellulales bacterium]
MLRPLTEISPEPAPPSATTKVRTAFLFALAAGAAAALAVDLPIARWLGKSPSPLPKDLLHVIHWSEAFAHAIGVGVIALAIGLLDPARRVALPRLLTMSWGSGLIADLLKLSIVRLRPKEFDFTGGVFETFGPLGNFGNGHGSQSFPSAHSAVAVGLAVALCHFYPRGRWLFIALAVLACSQRMESGAHFLSDVLAGATVGYLFANGCIGNSWLARRFDRWEAAWQERSSLGTLAD